MTVSILNHPFFSSRQEAKFWVSALDTKRNIALRLSLLPWLAGLIAYLVWWFNPQHHVNVVGTVAASSFLLFQVFTQAYFFFFALRMRVVDPGMHPDPRWRLAMVVTKAPSEPWSLVRTTLQAMLAQDLPHDTWLADEDPSQETIFWCKKNGVHISSRKNCAAYHRLRWPRRTRCKEGNLAYFYDNYAYRQYDIVAQLDADHVPEPDYLRRIATPFRNPKIGYVAAPSICNHNSSRSWAARGRLHAKTLHGPLQMGYNSGWAPLCIGSHYAVRTQALKQIGGLGPELAEDHSTTLMMNAAGWDGAFQPDAIAHGDGPATFADCMTQEYQWSRSLTVILLTLTPKYLQDLSILKQFQFVFSQTWYLLFSSTSLIGFLAIPSCLIAGEPIVRVSYPTYILLASLVTLASMFPLALLRKYHLLRPSDVPLVSWERGLFELMRFPWVLGGIVSGCASALVGRQVDFKVTPKDASQASALRGLHIAPYLGIAGLTCLVVIIFEGNRFTQGYHLLALFNCWILIVGVIAILTLQRLEIPSHPFSHDFRSAVAVVLLLVLLSQASILRLETGIKAAITTNSQPELARIGGHPMFGYHDATGSLAQAGVASDIGSHFIPWGERYQDQISRALRSDTQAGRQSLVTLEPWPWALLDSEDWDERLHQQLLDSLLKDLAAGQHDDALMASLRSLASDPTRVVYVRLMHEMEIKDQYPWWSRNPYEYTSAYRHIVHLARTHDMTNLRWVWSPAGFSRASSYWPGDDVVDYVGLSIYATPEWNGGLKAPGANLSLDQLLKARYWVRRYEKPIILAEVGINDTEVGRRRWFAQAIHDLPYFTDVVAWVYFNQPQPEIVKLDIPPPDWSLDSNEALDLRNLIERRAQ